jgi:hypothetical protein
MPSEFIVGSSTLERRLRKVSRSLELESASIVSRYLHIDVLFLLIYIDLWFFPSNLCDL